MWTSRFTALLLAAAVGVASIDARSLQDMDMDMEMESGSFWAIYDAEMAPANSTCLVTEGEAVDDSCCMDAGEILAHSDLQGNYTCFVLGEGLIPFSGCVGDGVAGYGENCSGEGAPFEAMDAEECGCSFVIEGSGCYKANDIPGQQWFVYLDGEACATSTDAPTPASGAFGAQYALAVLALAAAALI